MVDHRWQHDYTGPCDLKIKLKLVILSGFWNSTSKYFHPNKSVTLNIKVCITQYLIAAELLGTSLVHCVTDECPVADAIPRALRLAALISAVLLVPGDFGSLAEVLTLCLKFKTLCLVFSTY